jgi:hypothetical protein
MIIIYSVYIVILIFLLFLRAFFDCFGEGLVITDHAASTAKGYSPSLMIELR